MEPIINSQLPEFKVQAFQNGTFKTVTNEDVKGKWAVFFFYPADFILYARRNWWTWLRIMTNFRPWAWRSIP